MKKWFVGMISVFLCVGALVLPCTAAEQERGNTIVDHANLLTESEETELRTSLEEISVQYECDLVIVTVDSLDSKSPMAYADDYYDENGYGLGPDKSGVLFLISMEERDWWVSTHGKGITAFTDWGIDYIFSKMKDDLADDNFYAAFCTFTHYCNSFLEQAQTGEPFDSNNEVKEIDWVSTLGVSAFIGAIAASIVLGVMISKMKNVRPQPQARSYMIPGSLKITGAREFFLYSTVTRVKKASSSSSSRGGGSSTHRSSSGRTHGGHGGKF